jgi:hypothetical protein
MDMASTREDPFLSAHAGLSETTNEKIRADFLTMRVR